jgi:transcriptional regulator with GAF, ATPase, and Fis domain
MTGIPKSGKIIDTDTKDQQRRVRHRRLSLRMNNFPNPDQKLAALMACARTVLQKRSFPECARSLFDHCCRLIGAVSGYVALLSTDGHENEVLFLESGNQPCSVDPQLPMPIRGLRATAYLRHQTVYDNDFMNSPWVTFMPAGHVDLRNVLFAPLNIDGQTVGIMGLANKPSDFTDDDAEIASVIGELAAIALDNSRYLDLLNEKTTSLEHALAEIKTLRGLLPICSQCRKVRDDAGLWQRLEAYLEQHTDTRFTHGLCPDCIWELYPDEAEAILGRPKDLDPPRS